MSEGCFGAAKRLLRMLKRNTDSLTLWDNFTMHNLINVNPPNNNDMLLLVFLTQSHDTVGSLKYKITDKFETYGEIS